MAQEGINESYVFDVSYRCPPLNKSVTTWSPFLRLAHDFRNTMPLWHYYKECLGDHALHYFYSGTGKYIIDGKSYPIAPRTVFLRRPGENSEFKMDDVPGRMLNIHFDLVEIESSLCLYPCPDEDYKLKEKLPPELPVFQKISNNQAYEQAFFDILAATWLQGEAGECLRKSLMFRIISLLYANQERGNKSEKLISHQNAINKAIRYIRSHPEKSITVVELARIAGVSRALFCRIFRHNVGMTPHRYINNHRISLATTELIYSDVPIKEIAQRCGFADVYHFSRIF